jgi:hypothetical protein
LLAVNTHRPGAHSVTQVAAVIDDHTPLPAHARFQSQRLWRVLSVGAVLWLLPMGLLWAVGSGSNTFLDMGWFFSKAAPLSGVTAAVVGVMLQLALFFAYHVWWPQGFSNSLDIWAAVFTLLWTIALFRFKWSVLKVLSSAAAIGLFWQSLGLP